MTQSEKKTPALINNKNTAIRYKDIYLGITVLLFSLILIFWLIPNFVNDFAVDDKGLNSRFFPYLVTLGMAFLSIILVMNALKPSKEDVKKEKKRVIDLSTILCIALFIVYQQAIAIIGLIPASFLALISLMLLYGFRSRVTILIYSTLLTLFLSFFFEKVAQVPLPRGIFYEWLF